MAAEKLRTHAGMLRSSISCMVAGVFGALLSVILLATVTSEDRWQRCLDGRTKMEFGVGGMGGSCSRKRLPLAKIQAPLTRGLLAILINNITAFVDIIFVDLCIVPSSRLGSIPLSSHLRRYLHHLFYL